MERQEKTTRDSNLAARTPAGAGGLEGTEILVAEDADEAKSVSEMGDKASLRRMGLTTPLEEYLPQKPSRGKYRRRSSGITGDTSDEGDSPTKKQRYSKSSFQSRGTTQDSENDGLRR